MRVNYEEKTFEQFFNIELSQQGTLFPFGQVQEGVFGTDASVCLNVNAPLWSILNAQPIPATLSLADIETALGNAVNSALGTIKTNVLFQYKKPEYLTNKNAKEWNEWSKPYFRYTLYHEQHQLLLQIGQSVSNNALIFYASPAIKDITDLVNAYQKGKIIASTNFIDLSQFNKTHHHVTYSNAGTTSKLHSEVEEIKVRSFAEHLKEIECEGKDNRDKIIRFAKMLNRTINELHSENAYTKAFKQRLAMAEDYISNETPLLSAFITIKAFTEISGTSWAISTTYKGA